MSFTVVAGTLPAIHRAQLLLSLTTAFADSIGLSLTDTLDDLINEGRIEPQLAMKILANFDRAITEVLAEKVKARLNFKVHPQSAVPFDENVHADPESNEGPSGHVSLLRRSLDLSDQGRQFQAGELEHDTGRQGQDCQLQYQEAWRAVGVRS